MSETNSLELINKLSQENLDQYCSKEDIELLVLHTLDINRNTLYRENPSLDDNECFYRYEYVVFRAFLSC